MSSVRISIRVDDLGWSTEPSDTPPIKRPDIGLQLARRFHEAMGGVPYLGGVIPACVDDDGLAWLRSRPEGLTVALHGWDHGADRPDERDEFADMGEQQVRARLAMAQRRIGPTPHFIPPYNALPANFPRAAWHEGLRFIWGREANWPTPPQPYPIDRIHFIPAWAPMYGAVAFQQSPSSPVILETLEEQLRHWDGRGSLAFVITLHITWEAARDPEFDCVRRLVERVRRFGPREHVISPDQFVAETCQ